MKKLDIDIYTCKEGRFLLFKNDTGVSRVLINTKKWQPVVLIPSLKHIRLGDVVMDIGANCGALTVPFAKAVGDKGVVHAFEPQRIIFQQLCANIILNGLPNVHTYNIGIADSNKVIKFRYKNHSSDCLETMSFGQYAVSDDSTTGDDVEVRTIDSFNISNVAFMKIDIEGYELHCLRGAVNTIKKYKPVIILEANNITPKQKKIGGKNGSIHKFLSQFGYNRIPLIRANGQARDFLFTEKHNCI